MKIKTEQEKAKAAWEKFNKLKAKAAKACEGLSKFAEKLGYMHLSGTYEDALFERNNIFEGMLEDDFGPDPQTEEQKKDNESN